MNLILIVIINVIIIFIAFTVLNSRIRKNSTSEALDRYMREVDNLVVQLNGAVDEVVGIAEERIEELKEFVEKARRCESLYRRGRSWRPGRSHRRCLKES